MSVGRRSPARFLAVGAAGYVVNVATFAALVAAGVKYVFASVVSYVVSNVLMYLGNRYFTFGSATRASGLPTLATCSWARGRRDERHRANGSGRGLGLDETLAQPLSLLIVMPPAFVMFKRWTFRIRAT